MNTEWSPMQLAIFEAVKSGNTSLLVDAKAGSGKTTTKVKSMDYVDPFGRSLAVAFNKVIADTLSKKVPPHVEAKTINGLGHRIVSRALEGPKLVAWKATNILKQVIPNGLHDDFLDAAKEVYKCGRSWGVGVFEDNSIQLWESLIDPDRMNIPTNLDTHKLASWLYSTFERQIADKKTIDFDDQILYPLIFEFKVDKYDTIFVDEAQDLSPLQHEFIKNLLNKGGRIIAVGDPHQAIYAFRGADTHSMAKLRDMFSMDELPLSISYRCASEIIKEAQQFVPEIEAWDKSPQGSVNQILFSSRHLEFFQPKDLVLCRNNAPLISLGMRFLAEHKPVHVRGNFENIVFTFIDNFKTDSLPVFTKRLEEWYDAEVAEAEEKEMFYRLAGIQDKYDGIQAVLEQDGITSVKDIKNAFRRLFTPKGGTILSTIHRAKGEEANNVFLLRPELLPSRYAQTQEQLQQEYNLQYVAITRAKENFTYLQSEGE